MPLTPEQLEATTVETGVVTSTLLAFLSSQTQDRNVMLGSLFSAYASIAVHFDQVPYCTARLRDAQLLMEQAQAERLMSVAANAPGSSATH